MIYELWDYDAANIIYTYPTEADALAVVAGQIEAFGRVVVETWVLLENDGTETEEGLRRIAYGADLADRALQLSERSSTLRTAD